VKATEIFKDDRKLREQVDTVEYNPNDDDDFRYLDLEID
jgi:hypothetical protein